MSTVGANASDVGLVVQGLLIFLSAVVGVLGYIVQARSHRAADRRRREEDKKDKAHEIKLASIRDKLHTFVGPASAAALAAVRGAFFFIHIAKNHYPEAYERELLQREREGRTLVEYFKATWSNMDSFVGEEIEALMVENPSSALAKAYRAQFRADLKRIYLPLAELLTKYSGHLMDWQTPDEFKKRWPCYENGIVRNTFMTRFISFAAAAEGVVEHYWDQGDYSVYFPPVPFPTQISMYLLTMAGRLRQKLVDTGQAEHETVRDEDEKKNLISTTSKYAVKE